MNIDDLVDDRTGLANPGERFHDDWLDGLPTGQWPSYIDESARLVADGIAIGDTDLTRADFGFETGRYYREGLARAADIDADRTSLPLGKASAADVGEVAWVFNRLREEIRRSDRTGFRNPSRAIEAAINKALVESIEDGRLEAEELETIRLPGSATVSTLVSEVFCRPRSDVYIRLLLETVRRSGASSLLEHIDEPRMVTPLWDHQRDALDAWLAHDGRGYVDMATATGKTVLGLAAIAHHFGALHPTDRGLVDERLRPETDGRATVLVVAHRGLILDQWKREFDTHLNIPEQSTTRSGEHTAEFEWGDVHFWTPNRLREAGVPDADLVVLDETHHYLGSSGFGGILDAIDGHLLALSGSLDEANARTLERRSVPELFEFTVRDGQRAGVVPQCDWDVVFTPYEEQSQLAEVTERCRTGIERYADGGALAGRVGADAAELAFETLSEARSLAQSSVGRELKEEDPAFREFASAVMARQLTQYNVSPALSTVVRLVLEHVEEHKCVVLLETGEEIDWVTAELEARIGEDYDSLVTVLDGEGDLSKVESFDRERDSGAIVGAARTLGEGVDMETADVCINRGRGRLSRSLVQRMGRILRNPDGEKHARFFHVSGVTTDPEATLPREDGVTLLETASQLLSWGAGFRARPVFEVDTGAALSEADLADLERAGADALEEWIPSHYELPADDDVRAHLETLRDRVREHDGSALTAIEREEPEEPDTTGRGSTEPGSGNDAVRFVPADGERPAIPAWLHELATAAAEGDATAFVEASIRSYLRETTGTTGTTAFPDPGPEDAEETREVELNPALDAVLTAHAGEASRTATVTAALASSLRDDIGPAVRGSGIGMTEREAADRLAALAGGGSS